MPRCKEKLKTNLRATLGFARRCPREAVTANGRCPLHSDESKAARAEQTAVSVSLRNEDVMKERAERKAARPLSRQAQREASARYNMLPDQLFRKDTLNGCVA